MGNDTQELLDRARSGDGEAFRELTEPHRHELRVHCYRMLGSFQDAEDVLQESLLAAWLGLAGYEGRASVRTWLYRIATNRCLNARRAAGRRRGKVWDVPGVEPPEPTRMGEVVWLQPFPDELIAEVVDPLPGPHARIEQAESMSLAFVTALQVLPPRQLAVVVLRDVLGYPASEVADLLDTSVESVTSALKRARAGLDRSRTSSAASSAGTPPAPAPGSAVEAAFVERFVRAYEASDIDGLVAMFTDDVFMSMPPLPLEYEGVPAVAGFMARILRPDRRFSLVRTRANGQPAFGTYLHGPGGIRHGTGLFVVDLAGDRVRALTRFEDAVLPWFGLPRSLPPA